MWSDWVCDSDLSDKADDFENKHWNVVSNE